MMLSYLQAVQSITDPSVYGRGVRLYLEGRVGQPNDEILDFWREYEVFDKLTYVVRIPVLHMTMSREKWPQATLALQSFATCTCEYFGEIGMCKHIVGVCAALENEFKIEQSSEEKGISQKLQSDTVLDTVFAVEHKKQSRVWSVRLEQYFHQSQHDIPAWMSNMVITVQKSPDSYSEFISDVVRLSRDALRDYMQEKRLVRLINYTFGFGNILWWEIWNQFFDSLVPQHQRKIQLELWQLHIAGVTRQFDDELLAYLIHIDSQTKQELIESIREMYPTRREMWVNFVFQTKATEWLSANLVLFAPLHLVEAAQILPELHEEIEERILNQVKVWADFLQSGDYEEVGQTFQTWKKILGRSKYYEEAVQYFKQQHPKKKKLIALIS